MTAGYILGDRCVCGWVEGRVCVETMFFGVSTCTTLSVHVVMSLAKNDLTPTVFNLIN